MAEPISIQQLKDASLDVKSLEEVVNGDENVVVTTRLGETYPSVKGSIKKVFENGGLPATPFATKALMTASALVDGDFAQVTDETLNNGLYVKTGGAWVKSGYSPAMQDTTLTQKITLSDTSNLNDLVGVGFYLRKATSVNWEDMNYPVRSAGYLEVLAFNTSSFIVQKYITKDSIYIRSGVATDFTAWVSLTDYEYDDSLTYKNLAVFKDQDADSLRSVGYYLKNSASTGSSASNLPTLDIGILKVYTSPSTSMLVQEYVQRGGVVSLRYWNGSVWSSWQNNNPKERDLKFIKTADTMEITQPAIVNNSVKFTLKRQVDTSINLDAWGITGCVEVDSLGATLRPITSAGVWDCAIQAVENKYDHSGSGHGDEVLTSAYFMIDGVYYPQDFTGGVVAKEIQFVQKSTIYIEDKLDVLAEKYIIWTFTTSGINIKQEIKFPQERALRKCWLSMLPILRKSNTNNTGIQITDTEIRSQDGVVIDASEPGFELRELPISAGDNITLSSNTSRLSGRLTVNAIKSDFQPEAFVQNTERYNKIYVSAIPLSGITTAAAGSVWSIDTTFNVNTRSI